VSRLFKQCGILNVSQPYRPPRPVTGIALLYIYSFIKHTPAIATESFFIDVFFTISLTTSFGPSSGESQYIIFSHTSPENYRYLNGSVVSNFANGECTFLLTIDRFP
jgi:hypothetical protein